MSKPPSESEYPSPRRSSSTAVAEKLARILAQGLWPTGARLPSTRELSGRFGASRATIQRALRMLADRGVVECRPRSGWYVRANKSAIGTFDALIDPVRPAMQIGFSLTSNLEPTELRNRLGETWIGSIISGTREALEVQQVDMLMLAKWSTHEHDAKPFFDRIDQLGDSLGGVVVVQPASLSILYEGLNARDIPWVVIDRPNAAFTRNFVSADNLGDCYRLGYLFGKMGYEKIFVLSGNPSITPSCDEKMIGLVGGYIRATNHGPTLHRAICESSDEEFGQNNMARLLKDHGKPDAVFTSGDKLAIGAISACNSRGLHVPRDVAVVGTTGLDISHYTQPSLTVMTQPSHKMGAAAAEMILHMANEGIRELPGRCITGELVIRDSMPVPDKLLAELDQFLPTYPWGEH